MALPDDFWTMLTLLGKAHVRYQQETGHRVVIVGGAAVSFYTDGAILSGDVDLVADIGFERCMLAEGFEKETGSGKFLGAYAHPMVQRMSVELVSGALFDGRTDDNKLQLLRIAEEGEVLFAPIEDMIADRLGQYAASKNKDAAMLGQARLLMQLAISPDITYLRRRITEESGDPAMVDL